MRSSTGLAARAAALLFLVLMLTATTVSVASTRPAGVVNVNTATLTQLKLLPGIGEGRAHRIVSFRKLKPFKRVVELARVKGIGRKTVRKLKPFITVSGPTTLTERPKITRE